VVPSVDVLAYNVCLAYFCTEREQFICTYIFIYKAYAHGCVVNAISLAVFLAPIEALPSAACFIHTKRPFFFKAVSYS
jgi:hypothetical protein